MVLLTVLLMALLAAGCGGSDSDSVSQQELEAARVAGEEAAEERERVDRLERQVRSLRRGAKGGADGGGAAPAEAATQAIPAEAAPAAVLRSFHAPSGNVSCEVRADAALCAVASIDATFVLTAGAAAKVEPGAVLARGSGELAPYGVTIAAGTVTCTVPAADEPRGVSCLDSASGHGFEASRVPSRQKTY